MDIQEELESHPALFALVTWAIENNFPVTVKYSLITMGSTILWTEPPKIIFESTPHYKERVGLHDINEGEGP